jgi:hypothetical protein
MTEKLYSIYGGKQNHYSVDKKAAISYDVFTKTNDCFNFGG